MADIIISKHPLEHYGNKWITIKFVFIFVMIVTLFMDLYIESFFHSDLIIRAIRISLLVIAVFIFVWLIIWEYSSIKSNDESIKKNNSTSNIKWKYDCYDVWDNYKHADRLYHQRFNFFLVAESMLIVSFSTTLTSELINIIVVRIAIIILGIVFTLSWFYVNRRLDWRLVFLSSNYLEKNEEYNKYIACTRKYAQFYTGLFLSNILPGATFAFWYFLFYITRWNLL